MRTDDPDEKRIRELRSEAAQIERDKARQRRLEAVEKLKQVEGWEQKLTEAVLASIAVGECMGSVELLSPPYPRAAPLDNVSAWISFTVNPVWIEHE